MRVSPSGPYLNLNFPKSPLPNTFTSGVWALTDELGVSRGGWHNSIHSNGPSTWSYSPGLFLRGFYFFCWNYFFPQILCLLGVFASVAWSRWKGVVRGLHGVQRAVGLRNNLAAHEQSSLGSTRNAPFSWHARSPQAWAGPFPDFTAA